ncbi:Bug family tripartite tricarboxylate transporter substrate binding protein [Ferrovibrio sp.]|uniref:Bug family tripartite tricarboxylate transporter substrate binding protein n=1 Tax=Ferrovibrio sp. TaxID=1917215 RepID=UPI003D0FFEF4
MLTRRHFVQVGAATAALSALPSLSWAQTWNPSQTVSMVVPYPAGGPTDALARLVGQEIAKDLGQQVIVENVPGGAGAIGSVKVARGPADGHMLLASTNQTHATNISLLPNGGGYDPVKDFAPIALLADLQHILVVKNDLPVKNFAEFLALAKAQPGKLNCGSTGPGSASHLALELFKVKAGVDLTHVAYKGSAPLLQDLLGGHVDCSFATTPTVLGQVQTGKLRAIAVASPNRSPHLPELPTIAQGGVAGVEADAWLAIFAPAATPAPALARYRSLVLEAMKKDSIRETFTKQGMTVNVRDAANFAKFQQEDIKRWAEVIRVANVKAE